MRINRFVAMASGVSRRQADKLIEFGRVKVNGVKASIGQVVQPGDVIALDGKTLEPKNSFSYIAFHKPVGYVCSRARQDDLPTIYELLPQELQKLKTVGRLDKDSSGLIILTDDGKFAQASLHPSYNKQKVYQVELDKKLTDQDLAKLDRGIKLSDAPKLSQLMVKSIGDKKYQVILSEGRNRQIRRSFGALDYTVKTLHRIKFADYELGDLEQGKFRNISAENR